MGRSIVEHPDSRDRSSIGLDERDLPELRDDSEPLDLLKWELTALKLGRDLDMMPERPVVSPWKRVQHVRDAVAAEIEVKKQQKAGPCKTRDDRPSGFDVEREKETIGVQITVGTEDNPIITTKSLDNANRMKNNKKPSPDMPDMNSRTATAATATATAMDKKPPLPPRSRPPLSPTKQPVVPPPPVPPSYKEPQMEKDTDANETDRVTVVKRADQQNFFQPIIIDTVTPSGDYLEPIFVDSGMLASHSYSEPPEINTVDSAFKQVRPTEIISIDSLVTREQGYDTKIVSPCQNSSIIKSAYALSSIEEGPTWPEELQVVTDILDDGSKASNDSPAAVKHVVDLSQMDADELEAEYARLVGEKAVQNCATLSATLSDSSESQEETEGTDESIEVPLTTTATKESEAQEDTGITCKRKPLDELRMKSMVIDTSSGEHEGNSTGCDMQDSRRFIPLTESKDEQEIRQRVDSIMDKVQTLHRDPSVGQEPPEARQDDFIGGAATASSDDGREEESQGPNEDDDANEDDEKSLTMSEREAQSYYSLSKDAGTKRKHERIDYDFPSIESVVAEYFGSGTSKITGGEDTGKAYIKKTLFSQAGGCCLAFH